MDEDNLPLEEFVKLPTTVQFHILNTKRAQDIIENLPYIRVGIVLEAGYIPIYTNRANIADLFAAFGSDFIGFFPRMMSPLDQINLESAGITAVLNQPYLNLSGEGVVIGIVDSGIDYTKDVFRFPDGTTKIISIWDQTLDGPRGDDLYYGAEFSRSDIDNALESENPLEVVPTVDTHGHGTFLASIAAGSKEGEFSGAAPNAQIIAVKLKKANEFAREKFFIPEEAEDVYSSLDFMLGANYVFDRAEELNLPVVLCIGMGSNFSGHDGNTPFEEYISVMSQRTGFAIVTAGGNESDAKHHTQGKITETGATDSISIRVGEKTSFSVSLFSASYDTISVAVIAPAGEAVSRVPFQVGFEIEEELILERTKVKIGYYKDVNSVVVIGFESAKEGIWEIRLYGDSILDGEYHAWLPITGQVNETVEFMKPVPEYTIVFPATSLRAITCGAYDSKDNSLYLSSSWGPTRLPRMAPDFVAPGVDVLGMYPQGFGTMTGTSVSAAITAGAAALLLEWGIVQGNMKTMDGEIVRLLLISGCDRDEGIPYPNTKWGYGKLNLFQTFLGIAETSATYQISGGGEE